MSETRAIILAAGKGTRMRSDLPKVLHPVCGRPMLQYVIDAVSSLKTYVVVGYGAAEIKKTIGHSVTYVLQDKLLGTGDAVRRVQPLLKNFSGNILVLCGDTPLLEKRVVAKLLAKHKNTKADATVLSSVMCCDPSGYGRMVRDRAGKLLVIREHNDASPQERAINEINVGMYCFNAKALFNTLKAVKLNPKKKEFYLTDVIEILLGAGKKVETYVTVNEGVELGINSRVDLAQAQAVMRSRILDQLMLDGGVTVVDPSTTYVESGVSIGRDTVLYPCTYIHGDVKIGNNCKIGPFARVRSGCRIADGSEIGNFTEISRSKLGRNVFMKHFSFLGDATVGSNVNIGAGTITANYDGVNKNKTVIADKAFIGSDSILIAPVTIGKGAVVGAGSVVKHGTHVLAGSTVVGVPARCIKR